MPDQPLVSVITAVYNGQAFLSEAIAGVLAQSYPHWEYWLVNDGSTDATTAIARQAAADHPGRIHYLEHPGFQNRGACTSRNLALANARGKYAAILDADDFWFPHKLAGQIAIAQQFPQAGLIYSLSEYWRDWSGDSKDAGTNHVPPLAPGDRLYHPPELMRISYPLGPYGAPCPSSMLIDRELLSRLGGFEERFNRHQVFEDQAFLAKLYLSTPVYVSIHCWDRYRIHPDSCCSVAERTGKLAAARRIYFQWLHDFLLSQNVSDQAIWKAWRRETLRYRHPVLFFCMRVARRLKRTLRPSNPPTVAAAQCNNSKCVDNPPGRS
jgi:glycosyltransferase involved in cell wall biosynthesis